MPKGLIRSCTNCGECGLLFFGIQVQQNRIARCAAYRKTKSCCYKIFLLISAAVRQSPNIASFRFIIAQLPRLPIRIGESRVRDKKSKQHKKFLKKRILRYFEDGQKNSHGSFCQTKDMLLQSKLFATKEFDVVHELLEELVNKGFLEYQGGCYYLNGHAPRF